MIIHAREANINQTNMAPDTIKKEIIKHIMVS